MTAEPMNRVFGHLQVNGDQAPNHVMLESGRLGFLQWSCGPVQVALTGMSPAHMRNLAQILVGLAVEAEDAEVAA